MTIILHKSHSFSLAVWTPLSARFISASHGANFQLFETSMINPPIPQRAYTCYVLEICLQELKPGPNLPHGGFG